MKIAFVRWHDSMRETGWRSAEDVLLDLDKPDAIDCETVGFVVGENTDRVILALNHQAITGGEEMVGETIIIPKSAVVDGWELQRAPPAYSDAGDSERNHYDWFMPVDPIAAVDDYLDDFEAKLREALTDPFVHDMAQSVLPLIAAYRELRDGA